MNETLAMAGNSLTQVTGGQVSGVRDSKTGGQPLVREAEDGTGEAMFESIKVPQVKGMSVDGT